MLTMRVRGSVGGNPVARRCPTPPSCSSRSRRRGRRTFPPTAGSARIASVALPPLRLRSCPQPQRMTAGLRGGVELGDALQDHRAGMPASSAARSNVHGPRLRAQPLGAARVRREERAIRAAALEQVTMDGERDRQVGAGTNRQGGGPRAWRAASSADRPRSASRRGAAPRGCAAPGECRTPTDSRPRRRSGARRGSPGR